LEEAQLTVCSGCPAINQRNLRAPQRVRAIKIGVKRPICRMAEKGLMTVGQNILTAKMTIF
jgi:hypothetical protein